jgi:16S rRNA (cytidine1402-2'-O)-methyltransferase
MTSQEELAPGLYLVATPIGNLEDITLRALRVLRSVDRIACEDTRQTQKLLNHFEITTPTISCHEHNEKTRASELLADLSKGAKIAVVSDAGIPGISDPGMTLASVALEAGIPVIPVPGANAAVTALIASGLNAASFRFEGFLPEKPGARRTALERLATSISEEPPPTIIFYEAPHRILDTLIDVEAVWGSQCKICVARELTKLHEEFLRGEVGTVREELNKRDRIRGEITLLLAPHRAQTAIAVEQSVSARLKELYQAESLAEKEALKRIARERGLSKSDIYRQLQRERAK